MTVEVTHIQWHYSIGRAIQNVTRIDRVYIPPFGKATMTFNFDWWSNDEFQIKWSSLLSSGELTSQ